MTSPVQSPDEMVPSREFFIGIDSDGCVFDSMELKHKECFCPQFINHFGLQAVSKYARETWDFVNLYSTTRGSNRFLAVIHALDLLAEREEVRARNVSIPGMKGLRDWIGRETRLGNPVLNDELKRTNDPDLAVAYEWSVDVNRAVEKIVHGLPPLPGVRECLEKMEKQADVIVVSQTPCEALQREWRTYSIDRFARMICGQEMGTKTEHIRCAAGGGYSAERTLMIGDAPGDLKAAKANGALFYPVIPGREEESWRRLLEEGLDRFFAGSFAGEYEARMIDEFNGGLPGVPPWKG